MSVENETYLRIRGSMCEEHGLGKGITYRNDPRMLDDHAHYIEKLVLEARKLHAKTTERSTA